MKTIGSDDVGDKARSSPFVCVSSVATSTAAGLVERVISPRLWNRRVSDN